MNLLMGLFVGVLFVVLTPGVLVRIPKRGKPLTVALVHGLVFAVIFHFTAKMLYNAGYIEGFQGQIPLSAEAEKIARRLGGDTSLRTPERTVKLNIANDLSQGAVGRAAFEAIKKDLRAIAEMNSMLTSNDDDGTKFDKLLDFQINYINKYGKSSGQPSSGECKAYAKEWETIERQKFKVIATLAANATNEINVLTNEINDLRTRKGAMAACQKLIAASRGRLNMNGCMNSTIQGQINIKQARIGQLQGNVKNEMAKTDSFQRRFESACRGKTGCEDLIGKKVQTEGKADWYCTAKMDKECVEVMTVLRDIVSQLQVYKC
jgi:hypothetical protein